VQRHIDPSAVASAGTRAGSPVLKAYQEHSAIPARSPTLCQSGDPLAAASSLTHGLISIRMLSHLKSLPSRFAEFHAEFDVCSLLQFYVHAEIANVTAHVVTNTRVMELPMFTQRRHSAC